jgi:hypothetical protein
MFFHTDTAETPWTVIKSDCKKRARLNAMRYVLHKMNYTGKDVERDRPDRSAARRPSARGLRTQRIGDSGGRDISIPPSSDR